MGACRVIDWRTRLAAYVRERRSIAFRWGSTDCAITAAGAYDAITGRSSAQRIRGQYKDQRGAAIYLRTHGGWSGIIESLGCQPCEPRLTQDGDPILVMTSKGKALGFRYGSEVMISGVVGLTTVPLSSALAAWRIL